MTDLPHSGNRWEPLPGSTDAATRQQALTRSPVPTPAASAREPGQPPARAPRTSRLLLTALAVVGLLLGGVVGGYLLAQVAA